MLERVVFDYRDVGEYLVHQYVIMPNHFHLLATTAKAQSPAKVMQLIKGRFSFELKKQYGWTLSPWPEGFAGRRVRDSQQFWEAAKYIEENPVKAHLCESPEQYPYSSAWERHRLDPMPELGLKPPGLGGVVERRR